MKTVLLTLVGLGLFCGVGYYWAESSLQSSFQLASAARDSCYAAKGYDLNASGDIPPEVSAECTQSFRTHEEGENQRYMVAGLIGLIAAGIGIALLGFLLRRKEPA